MAATACRTIFGVWVGSKAGHVEERRMLQRIQEVDRVALDSDEKGERGVKELRELIINGSNQTVVTMTNRMTA